MNNFREVKDDILNDWIEFREQTDLAFTNNVDKKHRIYFDEISDKILNSIPKQNRDFVRKQLNSLDDNLSDYVGYWCEKYYRNGFCYRVENICGSLEK